MEKQGPDRRRGFLHRVIPAWMSRMKPGRKSPPREPEKRTPPPPRRLNPIMAETIRAADRQGGRSDRDLRAVGAWHHATERFAWLEEKARERRIAAAYLMKFGISPCCAGPCRRRAFPFAPFACDRGRA